MRERVGAVLGFLALWLAVGFVLGTGVLLGPVRWTASLLRWLGADPALERLVINGVIAAFVVGSFLLTWDLFRRIRASGSTWVTASVPVGAYLVAGAAVWAWMSPGLMTASVVPEREPQARFTLGPYPTERIMRQLRSQGFTGVVSLLHPAVVPFEARLLDRERAVARDLGLEFIHAPMLPWVSGNAGALEKIREVARRDSGYYYIHCYLGRDRVGVARRALEEMGRSVADWTGGRP